jgi:hypothetical protein
LVPSLLLEAARQRTYDGMQRKARTGQVTGGAVFGYRNVERCVSMVGALMSSA